MRTRSSSPQDATKPEKFEIRVVIDPSLSDYFREGLQREHLDVESSDAIVRFVTSILNDTNYPIAARKDGDREIHLSYHLKSFADPIF